MDWIWNNLITDINMSFIDIGDLINEIDIEELFKFYSSMTYFSF